MIDGSNKVLLVRHSYVRGSHLPGGGVERDENLEQALRRELLKEPGIKRRLLEVFDRHPLSSDW
jgi:ADP-ribose pyrophosphatase YjhB (NUDIX family)